MDNPRPDAPFGADPMEDRPTNAVGDDAPDLMPDRGSADAATGHQDEPGSGPAGMQQIPGDTATSAPAPPSSTSLLGHLALYTLLRIALVVALTGVLMIFMPLIVALLFAIIVQLPLSWLLFSGPRRRVNESMAQASKLRRDERARLQSALHGDETRD